MVHALFSVCARVSLDVPRTDTLCQAKGSGFASAADRRLRRSQQSSLVWLLLPAAGTSRS